MSESAQQMRRRPGPRVGDFEERHRARLTEIVDVAAGLFARGGYAATSVDEVGAAAGLGRGALYHYIGSKANLLIEIHNRFMEPLVAAMRETLELEASWAAKFLVAAESHLIIQMQMLDHSHVVQSEFLHLPPEQLAIFQSSRNEYEAGWTAILSGGLSAGEFAVEDLSITRLAILGMLNYTVQWVRPSGALTAPEIARRYCRIVLGGIARSPDWHRVESEAASAMDAARGRDSAVRV